MSIVEPAPVQDTLVTCLVRVEILGGFARLTFGVDQTFQGEAETAIVSRIILPLALVPPGWLLEAATAPFLGLAHEGMALLQ